MRDECIFVHYPFSSLEMRNGAYSGKSFLFTCQITRTHHKRSSRMHFLNYEIAINAITRFLHKLTQRHMHTFICWKHNYCFLHVLFFLNVCIKHKKLIESWIICFSFNSSKNEEKKINKTNRNFAWIHSQFNVSLA